MRLMTAIASSVAGLLVLVPTASGAPRRVTEPMSTIAHTGSGELRGVHDGDVIRFRGVPYAQPPVGPLRWAPPRPVSPWTGVRPADRSGPPCAQAGRPPTGSTAEDCLHLDLTMPAAPRRAGPGLPVMVWLHGGGFSSGTGTEYDPRRLVTQGEVLVVTVDFRLGVLGNLALPGMTDGGSYGLQDQQAALTWVEHNAAAFGGDPGNVTLFGQSGGAVAICGQLTSPAARGLFAKAILESGSCGTTLAANASGPGTPAFGSFWRPLAEVERTSAGVAGKLGCTRAATMLSCLRALPVNRLLPQTGSVTAAAVGGGTLPVDPRAALRVGEVTSLPVLSGTTSDEQRMAAGVYQLLGEPITARKYPAMLSRGFGANAAAVLAEYPLANYPSPALAWAAVYTDSGFVCPQLATDAALSLHGPVFGYEFADVTAPPLIPATPGFSPGASHASELFYLFDVAGGPLRMNGSAYRLSAAQRRVADRMIAAWSTFARTGDPAALTDAATWPAWHGAASRVHVFTSDAARPGMTEPAGEHHCGFWATIR